MWFEDQPILNDTYEDYSFKSNSPVQKYYRNGMVRDLYINEEKYGFYAIDSTGETYRLVPGNIDSQYSLYASDYADISISNVSSFPDPDYISRSNDNTKMKNLCSDLAISGDSTKVGYGKIMVRHLSIGSTFGSWTYYNLNDMLDTNNRNK